MLCLLCVVFLQALQATPFNTDFPSTIQPTHAWLTLSFYVRVSANLGNICPRSDRPLTTGWEKLLLSFSLPSVTVTFIHPLMRPRVPPTFDEDNGPHILGIRFFLLNLHAIAPIQASESFPCFPSAPASHSSPRQTHNLNIVQPTRSTTTQDKTRRLRQLMPSMPSIFPFSGLAVKLSTFHLSAFSFSPAQPNV